MVDGRMSDSRRHTGRNHINNEVTPGSLQDSRIVIDFERRILDGTLWAEVDQRATERTNRWVSGR